MKTITDAITKSSKEVLSDLSSRLNCARPTEKNIRGALLSLTGLSGLLERFSRPELRLLQMVYANKDGVTFGEVEKELRVSITEVELMAGVLSRHLLTMTIKNRQLLNNKLDRIYGIEEIAIILNIVDEDRVIQHLRETAATLWKGEPGGKAPRIEAILKDRTAASLLTFLSQDGCIATLDEIRARFDKTDCDQLLIPLIENGTLVLFHTLNEKLATYIAIAASRAPALVQTLGSHLPGQLAVQNSHFLLLNLYKAFDTISTYGLFLTKQMEWRKIDKKRITEALIPLLDGSGKELPAESNAELTLFILQRLGCVSLVKDIAHSSLKAIKNLFDNPRAITARILPLLDAETVPEPAFKPPFPLPTAATRKACIAPFSAADRFPATAFETAVQLSLMAAEGERHRSLLPTVENRGAMALRLRTTLDLFIYLGILEIAGGMIRLSDLGRDLVGETVERDEASQTAPMKKSIYINPDFTMIIPRQEIDSTALYHLLTHADILQNDVIIHAVISKSSIVQAHKRGMTADRFIATLQAYSKNEIPQNLEYLLSEWLTQTIAVEITDAIILKSSNTAFIDELVYSAGTGGIVERISQQHLLVKREYIDEIIKIARKRDAVVTLFTDDDTP